MAAAVLPTLRDGDVTLRPIRARDAKPLERVLLENRAWLRQWEATYPGGGSVIDPEIVDTLVRRRSRGATSPVAALSPRELDVLRQMALGKTNSGIEEALYLSSSTVEKHVNSIFTKLSLPDTGVHRRVAAVLTFLQSAPG